jgi:hypothetical protein
MCEGSQPMQSAPGAESLERVLTFPSHEQESLAMSVSARDSMAHLDAQNTEDAGAVKAPEDDATQEVALSSCRPAHDCSDSLTRRACPTHAANRYCASTRAVCSAPYSAEAEAAGMHPSCELDDDSAHLSPHPLPISCHFKDAASPACDRLVQLEGRDRVICHFFLQSLSPDECKACR